MVNPLFSFLKKKEMAYRAVFRTERGDLNEAAKIVLADLRTFCNGTKSCFDKDPIEMARKTARQEVFQRITNFLEIEYANTYLLEEDYGTDN